MRRMLLISAAVAAVVAPALPARAGGYCIDQDSFQDHATNQVVMKADCFGPTVVRVDTGDEVTFRNLDSHAHTVGGVAGTFGDPHKEVASGERVAFRFEEEGVFPFFCVLHPGMAGAVVVGDGIGSPSAGTAAVPVDPAAASRDGATTNTAEGQTVGPAAIIATVVLAVGVLATILVLLRRRRVFGTA